MVPDDWVAEASTTGLNFGISVASLKLKESLTEFKATTWADDPAGKNKKSGSKITSVDLITGCLRRGSQTLNL